MRRAQAIVYRWDARMAKACGLLDGKYPAGSSGREYALDAAFHIATGWGDLAETARIG